MVGCWKMMSLGMRRGDCREEAMKDVGLKSRDWFLNLNE
jgi:hypothetical protein